MAQRLKALLVMILFFSIISNGQEELPFWQTKKSVYKEMSENRKIVVSVKDYNHEATKDKRILGAGHIKAPYETVLREVIKFENLTNVSDYFKKVVHKEKEKQVYIFIQAFGYQSRLLMKYNLNIINKDLAQLDWIIIWGRLKGMQGNFQIKRVQPFVSEISLWSRVKEIDIPIPNLVMNITLEVITEKVAQKMRAYLEEQTIKPEGS